TEGRRQKIEDRRQTWEGGIFRLRVLDFRFNSFSYASSSSYSKKQNCWSTIRYDVEEENEYDQQR
ncbi:MAG: hypothetical protein PVJ86_13460, partial [Phycisphaerales bacterium]